jgi:ribosomal protein S18 acetylase RimI-like enzyme
MDIAQRRRRQQWQCTSRSTIFVLVLMIASCSLSEVVAFSRRCLIRIRAETTHGTSFAARDCIMAKAASHHSEDDSSLPLPFVIREVQEDDLGAAANILADAFSSDKKLNFIAQRVERMDTYFNLKSRFETFRYAERSGALQCMLVAVTGTTTDQPTIIGVCEVDNRPPGGEINPAPRPYISNLAVMSEFRRKGAATALVLQSEDIVRESWGKPRLHLRVEKDNAAARAMYEQCGYSEQLMTEDETRVTAMLLAKTL